MANIYDIGGLKNHYYDGGGPNDLVTLYRQLVTTPGSTFDMYSCGAATHRERRIVYMGYNGFIAGYIATAQGAIDNSYMGAGHFIWIMGQWNDSRIFVDFSPESPPGYVRAGSLVQTGSPTQYYPCYETRGVWNGFVYANRFETALAWGRPGGNAAFDWRVTDE